ncbi:MAG: hypothetical protein HQK99_05830 [Nitrospirae bacterium]|nr:hypothetical protein [Nitrospirota bacterium]
MDERTEKIIDQFAKGRLPVIASDVEYAEQLSALSVYLDAIMRFALALSNGDLSQSIGQGVAGLSAV